MSAGERRQETGLWIAAALLAAAAMFLGGRHLAPEPALADVVAQAGEYVALTTDGGSDDVLLVLDQRSESVLVYQVRGQASLEFKSRDDVRELFVQARRSAGK